MPYCLIRTNVTLYDEMKSEVLVKASKLLSQVLGKDESRIIISLESSVPMMMGGSEDAVCFVELKSYLLPEDKVPGLSEKLFALMEDILKIPKGRMYIEFFDINAAYWGAGATSLKKMLGN